MPLRPGWGGEEGREGWGRRNVGGRGKGREREGGVRKGQGKGMEG